MSVIGGAIVMKIRIEIGEDVSEDEIVIRCVSLTPEIARIQKLIKEGIKENPGIIFYKGDTRVFSSLDEILFFETQSDGICAHTIDDCFEIQYRLYELEDMLPRYFMRISKSTILNTRKIFSIDKNLTASSTVMFRNTHKQVFVSRHYYKPLIERLDGTRNLE